MTVYNFTPSHLLTMAINKHDVSVHINDVQSGAACGCVCPGCGCPLVAKKGKKNQPHFAHAMNAVNCGRGQETMIHKLAKEVICDNGFLEVATVNGVKRLKLTNLKCEEYDSNTGFTPDITATLAPNNKLTGKITRIWIEIQNTHANSDNKLNNDNIELIVNLDVRPLSEKLNGVNSISEIKRLIEAYIIGHYFEIVGGRLQKSVQQRFQDDNQSVKPQHSECLCGSPHEQLSFYNGNLIFSEHKDALLAQSDELSEIDYHETSIVQIVKIDLSDKGRLTVKCIVTKEKFSCHVESSLKDKLSNPSIYAELKVMTSQGGLFKIIMCKNKCVANEKHYKYIHSLSRIKVFQNTPIAA